MKKSTNCINNNFTSLMFPFFLTFAFYIQIFGEAGPGGGFQAGALAASALIAIDLSCLNVNKFLSSSLLLKTGTVGFLVYFLTGTLSLFFGDNFLNYYSLSREAGQPLGIMIIELGIGICVSSVMLVIYLEFLNAD